MAGGNPEAWAAAIAESEIEPKEMPDAEIAEMDSDIIEFGVKLDAVYECMDNMQERTKEYLQPNPSARAKFQIQAAAAAATTAEKYPQVEFSLGEAFTKLASSLDAVIPPPQTSYSATLIDVGEGFTKLSVAKDDLDARVKEKFLDPAYRIQQKDIPYLRKLLEEKQVDSDWKKATVGAWAADAAVAAVAESEYERSKEICKESFYNYKDSELEHIEQLREFSEAIRDYHKQCTDIVEPLIEIIVVALAGTDAVPSREFGREIEITPSPIPIPIPETDPETETDPARTNQQQQPTQPCCRGLFDFEAENEGELGFKEADMIELLTQVDENWLEGRLNGREGYFPVTFVEIVVPLD